MRLIPQRRRIGRDALSVRTAFTPDSGALPAVVWIILTYGQSWASNIFNSFASYGIFDTQTNSVLAAHVASIGSPTFKPGPMPNSAGIALTGNPDGVTGYASSDVISVGRVGALAHQLLRRRAGLPTNPLLETCLAYPGSTWTSGGGGGLSPGATFTGVITNDVLTPSAITGTIVKNQMVSSSGVDARTVITVDNGNGTFNVGIGQTVIDEPMTTAAASFTGAISNQSAGLGNVLTVSSMTSGTIAAAGEALNGPFILAGTTILSQIDGTVGGVGNYRLQVGSTQTVTSRAMSALGTSWANLLTVVNTLQTVTPSVQKGSVQRVSRAIFKWFDYIQGGSATDTTAAKEADLTDMLTKVDTLNLPGAGTTGMHYCIGVAAPVSNGSTLGLSNYGAVTFCRKNAPGQGGPYSGRCWMGPTWYQWPFKGTDNIHTGDYGSMRHGEARSYIRSQVLDKGLSWTPLWLSLTKPITVSGNRITVPFDRPSTTDFAAGALSFVTGDGNGIAMPMYPQQGFHVFRGGADLPLSVSISGLNVILTSSAALSPGDVLNVRYAMDGPGGPSPGFFSGCGGNLVMAGPASVLFDGKTIDAWAIPFDATVTA